MPRLNMKTRLIYLELREPFGISRATYSRSESFFVNIDGGWGEGVPSTFYGETEDSVRAALEQVATLDLPAPDAYEEVYDTLCARLKGQACAITAVDLALHDRLARSLGVPVYRLFGKAPTTEIVTSYTIGIDTLDAMLQKVEGARGFRILKIKLGRNLDADMAVMREIRRAVGGTKLLVDANCGYTLDEARRAVRVLADLGVEYVEQPLKKGAIEELRALKADSPLPIFVDEDSVFARDIPALAGAADGINIKLMKCGGLTEARRMIAVARTFGLRIMIGSRIESSLAIAAAAHLAPFADHLDLDGPLLVNNDPFEGLKYDPDGTMHLSDAPGFGCAPRPEYRGQLE